MRARIRSVRSNTVTLRGATYEQNRLVPLPTTNIAVWSGVAPANLNVDVLLVGGGGGGGSGSAGHPGGGGGAGGVKIFSAVNLNLDDHAYGDPSSFFYNVYVGAGGAGGSAGNASTGVASSLNNADDTWGISVEGGGRGGRGGAGTATAQAGGTGPSGGGGAGATVSRLGGAANNLEGEIWGYIGGNNFAATASASTAGGGGGRSAAGVNGSSTKSGNGGAGVNHWGFLVAGGGGGGRHNSAAAELDVGRGGSDIGGHGDLILGRVNRDALPNTGSGGGGGNGTTTTTDGGAGSSGLIVIRYEGSQLKGQGGGFTYTDGSYVYHVYTADDTPVFSLEVFAGQVSAGAGGLGDSAFWS